MFLLFIIFNGKARSQFFDSSLNNYRSKVAAFLRANNGVIDPVSSDSIYFRVIYSTPLDTFCNGRLIFYMFGFMGSHERKYLGILSRGKLSLLPTKDFNVEFDQIVPFLGNCTEVRTVEDFSRFMLKVKSIYDYNRNPPWRQKNKFIK
jgi:hypothetical protein